MKYSATFLIETCDILEGKQINSFGELNDLLSRCLKSTYSLLDASLKERLVNDVKSMMTIENNQLFYKEF